MSELCFQNVLTLTLSSLDSLALFITIQALVRSVTENCAAVQQRFLKSLRECSDKSALVTLAEDMDSELGGALAKLQQMYTLDRFIIEHETLQTRLAGLEDEIRWLRPREQELLEQASERERVLRDLQARLKIALNDHRSCAAKSENQQMRLLLLQEEVERLNATVLAQKKVELKAREAFAAQQEENEALEDLVVDNKTQHENLLHATVSRFQQLATQFQDSVEDITARMSQLASDCQRKLESVRRRTAQEIAWRDARISALQQAAARVHADEVEPALLAASTLRQSLDSASEERDRLAGTVQDVETEREALWGRMAEREREAAELRGAAVRAHAQINEVELKLHLSIQQSGERIRSLQDAAAQARKAEVERDEEECKASAALEAALAAATAQALRVDHDMGVVREGVTRVCARVAGLHDRCDSLVQGEQVLRQDIWARDCRLETLQEELAGALAERAAMAQDRDISHARREEAATALRQVCSVHTHMIDTSIHTCHDIYQHIYIYALRQARAALGDSQAHNLRMHEELRAKVRAAVSAAGERDQCAAELRQATGELDEARAAAAAAFGAAVRRQAEHEAECENLRRDVAEKEHQMDVKDKEAVALFRRVVSAEGALSEHAGTHTQQLAAAAAEAEEQARAHQAELTEARKQVGNEHEHGRARRHGQMHTKID